MAADDVTIRVQVLDGVWETLGVDRLKGIYPNLDSLSMSSNDWGSDRASFDIHRDPGLSWPDLIPFTPLEIEVAGTVVWEGRISETPTRMAEAGVISVQCEGAPYALDDDVYQRQYVTTRLENWKDMLKYPDISFSTWAPHLTVRSDDGLITIGAERNKTWVLNQAVGVTMDFGQHPHSWPEAVSLGIRRGVGSPANVKLRMIASNAPTNTWPLGYSGAESVLFSDAATISQSSYQTFTPAISIPRRYVTVCLINEVAEYTTTSNDMFHIGFIRAFARSNNDYHSSGLSTLKSSTVVKDARDKASLLNRSNTHIESTSFSLPEFPMDGYRTARETMMAANAYEDKQIKVLPGRVLQYRTRPTAPIYEVGSWAGGEFEDASSTGDNIYNRVFVQATGPDGNPMNVERWSNTGINYPPGQPANAGSGNAADFWSFKLQEDTVTFYSAPSSLYFNKPDTLNYYSIPSQPVFEPLKRGGRYQFTFYRTTGAALDKFLLSITKDGKAGTIFASLTASTVETTALANGWTKYVITWVQEEDSPTYGIHIEAYGNTQPAGTRMFNIDDMSLGKLGGTLADRRGITRTKILPVSSALTKEAAEQIGNLWLQAHRTMGLKGSVKVTGDQGCRRVLGGANIHPSLLLLATGERMRISHVVDPETGVGKDGTITSVSYSHKDRTASVSLDNQRSHFESLMERLAIVTGQL